MARTARRWTRRRKQATGLTAVASASASVVVVAGEDATHSVPGRRTLAFAFRSDFKSFCARYQCLFIPQMRSRWVRGVVGAWGGIPSRALTRPPRRRGRRGRRLRVCGRSASPLATAAASARTRWPPRKAFWRTRPTRDPAHSSLATARSLPPRSFTGAHACARVAWRAACTDDAPGATRLGGRERPVCYRVLEAKRTAALAMWVVRIQRGEERILNGSSGACALGPSFPSGGAGGPHNALTRPHRRGRDWRWRPRQRTARTGGISSCAG